MLLLDLNACKLISDYVLYINPELSRQDFLQSLNPDLLRPFPFPETLSYFHHLKSLKRAILTLVPTFRNIQLTISTNTSF